MKTININQKNLGKILAIFNKSEPQIQGTKLLALYEIIQKHGEPMRSNDKMLDGEKCIQLPTEQYFAIVKLSKRKLLCPGLVKFILMEENNRVVKLLPPPETK